MNKLKSSLFLIGSLIIIIPSIYIFFRLNNSLKDQVILYFEYNNHPDKIITPVDQILLFEDEIPNISGVMIPIKIAKARYLFLEGKYDEAKKLIKEGRKHNPFLGIGDVILSRIYLQEGKLDSAVYFGKRSMEKLPNNESHVSFYQITQERVKDLEEIERVFLSSLHIKSEVIWQNYLISVATIKINLKLDFTDDEKKYLKQALEIYPENSVINTADKIINYGGDIILAANEFDSKAIEYFNEKNYQKAIDNWKKAINIIPNDEAYYLNTSKAYILLDDTQNAEKYYNIIEIKNLKGSSGKFEFIKALNYLKLNNIVKGCNFANISNNLGYENAQLILKQYNCYNN